MGRMRRILWPRGPAWRGGLTVGVAVALLAIAFALLYLNLSTAGKAKDVAAIIQSSVTAVAIVVGGVFAYYKLQLFRDLEPHLTITHEVSHRTIGQNYVHIAVTANLHNNSRVKIELHKAIFSMQLVSPLPEEEIEALYQETFVDKREKDLQWRTLHETQRTWIENELVIEPSGSHSETYEFVILSDVRSVAIYTYFYNPESSQHTQSADGWSATTVYDIIDNE